MDQVNAIYLKDYSGFIVYVDCGIVNCLAFVLAPLPVILIDMHTD